MRILTIISGILFLLLAAGCFAYQGVAFISIAFIIGTVMILQGVITVGAYIWVHKRMEHAFYVFVEGVLAVLFGLVVVTNQLVIDAMVPMFFGMWLLFIGILRLTSAIYSDKTNPYWKWIMGLGIVSALAGMYAFFNSLLLSIPVILLVSIYFLIQGANVIAMGVEMPPRNAKRFYHRLKEERESELQEKAPKRI